MRQNLVQSLKFSYFFKSIIIMFYIYRLILTFLLYKIGLKHLNVWSIEVFSKCLFNNGVSLKIDKTKKYVEYKQYTIRHYYNILSILNIYYLNIVSIFGLIKWLNNFYKSIITIRRNFHTSFMIFLTLNIYSFTPRNMIETFNYIFSYLFNDSFIWKYLYDFIVVEFKQYAVRKLFSKYYILGMTKITG